MSEHVMIVSDVATRTLEFDRWQASCSCGFVGNIGPEELADQQAAEHRVDARIAAAVAAEREACAKVLEDYHLLVTEPTGREVRLDVSCIAAAIRARGGQ